MKYEQIWKKVLNQDEVVKFEFSVGDQYRKIMLILWGVLSLLLLPLAGMGVLTFLVALFYFQFYLKVANAYAFTNRRVIIHKGWMSTHTVTVDYPKITEVTIIEPFFDRIITKTGNIVINTAGTAFYEVILRHIESPYEIKKILDSLRDTESVGKT